MRVRHVLVAAALAGVGVLAATCARDDEEPDSDPRAAAVDPTSKRSRVRSAADVASDVADESAESRREARRRHDLNQEIDDLRFDVDRLGEGIVTQRARVSARSKSLRIETVGQRKCVTARFLMAGRPVAGVVIEGAKSDAEGRIALTLPRNYRGFLVVTQPDGVQLNITPAQDDAESFDFGDVRIQPAGTITGTLVDEAGKPMAEVNVQLRSSDLDCRNVASATTNADGRFAIGGVGPYRYEAVAWAGNVVARAAAVSAGAELRLVAKPMVVVVLRQVADETGASLPGPWTACELRRPGDAYDASFHELRHSDADVRLGLAEPGWYEIDVRHGDADPAHWRSARIAAVEVVAGRENVIEVRLKRR